MRTLLLLVLLPAIPLSSQQLSQLSGLVTDPTGAVIAGAVIQLESQTRGIRIREVTTGRDGRYHFPQILPDRYRITAKAKGFNDVILNDVAVQVNTPATLDIVFEKIGVVIESISVSAQTPQINTVDASLGNAIGSMPILQLPSYLRNVTGLLALQPGVNEFGNVNGGKSDQANVTLDGIDVNEQMERTAFTSVLRVTLDSVEEFRTTTANANADQGRGSGAQVSLVTRSGTNAAHGSAYWYHRNTITAANGFFNNMSGVARPKLLINIPGASAGGPIRKNKLFYFFNWEQRSDRSEENADRTVPSAELRRGIVQYHTRQGQLRQLSPQEVRTLDPLGAGASQAVLQLLNSYPLPNDPSLGDGMNFQGYRFTAPVQLRYNTYIARFDYQLHPSHNFFFRGQLQNDRSSEAPQFPGEPPNSLFLRNAKGLAIGYNAIVSANMISNFRYGITRLSRESTGTQTASAVSFRGLSDRYGLTTGISRTMPVHQLSEDVSWNRGNHAFQFGGVLRFVSNGSRNFLKSFHAAYTNVSWLRGTGADFQPADLAPADRTAYSDAMMALLGIISQADSNYNYSIDGSVLPVGAPIRRDFRNEEYEMYWQDSWRVARNLTLSYGLRWSLMPPVHEANGVQVSTNIPLGDWFNIRGSLADHGRSQEEAGRIIFLSRDDPKARPIYPFHKKNFAPRLGIAFSPSAQPGWAKFLFGGPGRSSIRAGWGMFYDLIGQPLARTFDLSAFGFATTLVNPSGRLTASTAPRFTDIFHLPASLIRPAPQGGFPARFPDDQEQGFAITNSIDDKLKVPYTMNMNFSIGREFGKGWFVQGSYVGRMSRRSLVNRDLAMPTNLTDPASGQTYFEAASRMALLVNQRVAVTAVPPIPFWENMYSNLRTASRTASQMVYNVARFYPNDFTSALADLDEYCDPDCGRLGPNMMLNPQFSSLSAWSSIAGGNYHAMQWTLRKRLSYGLTLDFNYTYSKSQDLASAEENSGEFAGFLINAWNPSQRRGVSDYDQRHVWNLWWVYELPLGRSKKFAPRSRVLDLVVGGWQFSGIWTQSTELPASVGNNRYWPTNWNVTSFGTPVGSITESTRTKNAPAVSGRGGPNVWADPARTLAEWQFTLPGQSGSRNTLRIDGLSNFDFGLAKRIRMPYRDSHSLQFRWETFNVFNQVRFKEPELSRVSTATWGKYTGQLNTPRQMQFALRYEF
ncbi:MAG: carboxypeptidase regulatory-like domain-containing protein [Acidobacteria bacterium]|nr:carboxypeptidase regulatory-like domain-containing protein [Acidobacteriota bacterium]